MAVPRIADPLYGWYPGIAGMAAQQRSAGYGWRSAEHDTCASFQDSLAGVVAAWHCRCIAGQGVWRRR